MKNITLQVLVRKFMLGIDSFTISLDLDYGFMYSSEYLY